MRNILGVKISSITSKEVLDDIKIFLLSENQHHIITLNPEMIVEAQSNDSFKSIINEADLCVADGTGILLADRLLNGTTLPERIRGVDLMLAICTPDVINNKRIYLLGAGQGIAKRTAEVLKKKYPHLNIVGAEEGIDIRSPKSKVQSPKKYTEQNAELVERIVRAKPDILFVAFGAPKQEIWIHENIKKIPSIRLAIGIGGSFDFISGRIYRAPRIMQKLGMEWLWRLVQEPKRCKRIYNATIKFGWMVLEKKIKST
jgi:N-acetylglucosaminyldiphosphoundecaprenol N-acetyl-beta-D-mannosaminyltransferase